jgi:hypothetical protein
MDADRRALKETMPPAGQDHLSHRGRMAEQVSGQYS